MTDRQTVIAGSVVLASAGVGYLAWRQRLQDFPEAIEAEQFEEANALVGELFEMGRLGRDVRYLLTVLALCLLGLVLTRQ